MVWLITGRFISSSHIAISLDYTLLIWVLFWAPRLASYTFQTSSTQQPPALLHISVPSPFFSFVSAGNGKSRGWHITGSGWAAFGVLSQMARGCGLDCVNQPKFGHGPQFSKNLWQPMVNEQQGQTKLKKPMQYFVNIFTIQMASALFIAFYILHCWVI